MEGYFIIVAAGQGTRLGGNLPKQFQELNGRPLLMTTIERVAIAVPKASIIVVLSAEMVTPWQEMCRECHFAVPHKIALGGAQRCDSVKNALSPCSPQAPWIAVHDAARPLVSESLITRLLDALQQDSSLAGVIPVTPVTDSLRIISSETGETVPVDRSKYRAVQTPQIFRPQPLLAAYDDLSGSNPTDDASLVQAHGFKIGTVQGDSANFKVTYPGDIERVSYFLNAETAG